MLRIQIPCACPPRKTPIAQRYRKREIKMRLRQVRELLTDGARAPTLLVDGCRCFVASLERDWRNPDCVAHSTPGCEDSRLLRVAAFHRLISVELVDARSRINSEWREHDATRLSTWTPRSRGVRPWIARAAAAKLPRIKVYKAHHRQTSCEGGCQARDLGRTPEPCQTSPARLDRLSKTKEPRSA